MTPPLPSEVVVTRLGWLTWELDVRKGWIHLEPPPRAFGTRAHAERKARRLYAKHINPGPGHAETFTITDD